MRVTYDTALMELDARGQGLSDNRLGSLAGMAGQSVSRIFARRRCSPASAKKIAKALKKPLERYLVTEAVSHA